MPRPDRVFKNTYNTMLDRLVAEASIENKSMLARELGVSRTTVRSILTRLEAQDIVALKGQSYEKLRQPSQSDYFPGSETMEVRDALEVAFMRKIRDQELSPGSYLSEGQLARQLDVSVQTVREFLISLSRFGFVRKDHQRRWVLEGVSKTYALELHEVRELFESRAIEKVCCIPEGDPFWGGLLRLQQEHRELSTYADFSGVDFPSLDAKFHRFLNEKAGNGLIVGFQDAIAMIFNYHYLWPLEDQTDHHHKAITDHLVIIDNILKRDKRKARAAMHRHLSATRRRFMNAMCE